jgi:hypothetical protein
MIAAIRKLVEWFFWPSPQKKVGAAPVERAPYRLHIPRSLMNELRAMTRPSHEYGEPLAFLLVRFASEDSRTIIVGIAALPFPDQAYVAGPAGANFDTGWAVSVANENIAENTGLLLVHAHGGTGLPMFSSIDQRTNCTVMGALAVGVKTAPYGAMVLSDTDARCVLSVSRILTSATVVIVPDRFGELRITA